MEEQTSPYTQSSWETGDGEACHKCPHAGGRGRRLLDHSNHSLIGAARCAKFQDADITKGSVHYFGFWFLPLKAVWIHFQERISLETDCLTPLNLPTLLAFTLSTQSYTNYVKWITFLDWLTWCKYFLTHYPSVYSCAASQLDAGSLHCREKIQPGLLISLVQSRLLVYLLLD